MNKIKPYLFFIFVFLTGCITQLPNTAQPSTKYYVQATQLSDKPVVAIFLPDINMYYPSFSKRADEFGAVQVDAKIDNKGDIYDAKILKSSSYPRLDRAAVDLASRYRFKSYIANESIAGNQITFYIYFQKESGQTNTLAYERPSYPAVSNQNEAVVRVGVTEFGIVESVEIIQSTGNKKLDDEALRVGKSEKFRSMIIDGKPQKISTDLKVTFGK